ncbi:hypothetical protein MNV49_001838 [Pseudohyphozyma bogoriensis]|nr:hypothetical protein MNV49_001838 [Pseudohyphozyma bogoriensis]
MPNWTASIDYLTYDTSTNPSYIIPSPASETTFHHAFDHIGPIGLLVTLVVIAVVEFGFLVLAGLIKLSQPVKGRYAKAGINDDDEVSVAGSSHGFIKVVSFKPENLVKAREPVFCAPRLLK